MRRGGKKLSKCILACVLTLCIACSVMLVPSTAFAAKSEEAITNFVSGNELDIDDETVDIPDDTAKLSVPTNIRWEDGYLRFDAVPNAKQYYVKLYHDGETVSEVGLEEPKTKVSYCKVMQNNGPGDYWAEITAAAYPEYENSKAVSPFFTYDASRLDIPSQPEWNGATTAKWEPVPNADRYDIYLYKDNLFMGSGPIESYKPELDLKYDMERYGNGEYTFEVVAKPQEGLWKTQAASLKSARSSRKWFEYGVENEISTVELTIPVPTAGKIAEDPIIKTPGITPHYTWYEFDLNSSGYHSMSIDSRFSAGKHYMLNIKMEADPQSVFLPEADDIVRIVVNDSKWKVKDSAGDRKELRCNILFYVPDNDGKMIQQLEVEIDPVEGKPVIKTPGVKFCDGDTEHYAGTGYKWSVPGTGGKPVETLEAGKSYYINMELEPTAGYQFIDEYHFNQTQISVDGVDVTYDNDSMADFDRISCSYYFTMPSGYEIRVESGNAKNSSGAVISKALAGTQVTVTANQAPNGKVFDKWVAVSGGMEFADETAATTTFTMPAKAVEVKAIYKQREPEPGEYVGNINCDLKSFDLKQNDKGAYYLIGEIIVVEWVNGVSTVPKAAPTMTFKSTDGKDKIEVFVTPTGTNTYYFDRFIEGLDAGKEYVFEIASGDPKNISPNRSMNVTTLTSTYGMPPIKNLGKLNDQKISYYTASNGDMRLYRRTKKYVGNINSELKWASCTSNNIGNFVTGEIVVVEWENGVSTVPFEKPVMRFKSKKGVDMDVFITALGTNTYYFDRCLENLDTTDEFYFTITSGDQMNTSPNKSMIVTTTDMKQKQGTLWETSKQYVKYKTNPNNGQMIIYAVDK